MYKLVGDDYIFNGNLEEYLFSLGVSQEHVDRMKKKVIQKNKNIYYSFVRNLETGQIDRKEELVPLEKVIGTSRGTIGKSIFENVRMMERGEREPSRFFRCFEFANKMQLDELRDSYKTLYYPVEMDYYEEDDEYYLTSDGNHRTLTAMILGAEYIKANITIKHCDFDKRKKYFATEEFFNEFNILEVRKTIWDTQIIFADGDDYFIVEGYSIRENEDCLEYIDILSREILIDLKYVEIISKLPKIFQIIYGSFCKNKRVLQYIEKTKEACRCGDKVRIYDF